MLRIIIMACLFASASTVFGQNFAFETHYKIESKASGKCLDVAGASISNNAQIQVYPCHGSDNQRWYFESSAQNGTIASLNSDRCLDVNSHGINENVPVLQWGCHRGPNQQWRPKKLEGGAYQFISVASGKCLDVRGGTSIVQQYECHVSDNQKWVVSDPKRIDPIPQKGDLSMLDWCYELNQEANKITVYPIVVNKGKKRWFSNKEGRVGFVFSETPSLHVSRMSVIPAYPKMLISPDEAKKLSGFTRAFSEKNSYAVHGFTIFHDDDRNSENNYLEGLRNMESGQEFVDGKLVAKRCKK